MQGAKLAAALEQMAALLVLAGDRVRVAPLQSIATALASRSQSVAVIAGKLNTRLSERGSVPGQLAVSVSQMIRLTGGVFKSAGCGPASNDFEMLAKVVGRFSDNDFANADLLVQEAFKPPQRTARKTNNPPPLDAGGIRNAADELTSSLLDTDRFNALLAQAQKHPKETLEQIVNRFLGHERTYKSKPEAIKAARGRQLQEAMWEGKQRSLDKIRP